MSGINDYELKKLLGLLLIGGNNNNNDDDDDNDNDDDDDDDDDDNNDDDDDDNNDDDDDDDNDNNKDDDDNDNDVNDDDDDNDNDDDVNDDDDDDNDDDDDDDNGDNDIIEPPSNVISDESIIEGIIGKLIEQLSSKQPPGDVLDKSIIEGIIRDLIDEMISKIPIANIVDVSIIEGIIDDIFSQMRAKVPSSIVLDESIIKEIIRELLEQMISNRKSNTTDKNKSIIQGIIENILAGTPSSSSTLDVDKSDESIIRDIIGDILARTPSPSSSSTLDVDKSDKTIIEGIIENILAGTSKPSSPLDVDKSDKSIIEGIIGDILAGTPTTSSSLLPSMPSLINRILENVLRGIKFTGKGVVGITLLSGAIALGALYALGYIAPKELYKYINKLSNNTKITVEITDVIKHINSLIGANGESIEKLIEYTIKGAVIIVAGPPIIALGLAAGSLFGLGYITKKTLSTIVSNSNVRRAYQVQGESDEDIDEENELSDQIINDVEELVELYKKHHIIDKILDEPITYGEETSDMSPLVARIEKIEEVGDNINHNIIKEIFLEQEPVKNGPDNTMI